MSIINNQSLQSHAVQPNLFKVARNAKYVYFGEFV